VPQGGRGGTPAHRLGIDAEDQSALTV
jgi:hypothetical protein